MGFLTEELLAQEAARYGDAGPRPQVVWPNGVLASVAVGIAIRLLCPWNREPICPYLMYDGNRQTLIPSSRLAHIDLSSCRHFPQIGVGDPLWAHSSSKLTSDSGLPELLSELQFLSLIIRSDFEPVQRLGTLRHPLVAQPADPLAVL
jgi:hypothetical protein